MAQKRGTRDPRYSETLGRKPHVGWRYVVGGKVRIEWLEDGRRRSRTVGKNDPATRRAADEELEHILALQRGPTLVEGSAGEEGGNGTSRPNDPLEALREWVLSALDVADRLAAQIDHFLADKD